ncbi:hypothetical protein PQI07_25345 [Methylobacterium sp. 092160098-2]|uniref:hypothetical protein n=1 Tax=Methylobacterium sp. 092160098-2 TaxID=3025129 RepID=UPI002381BA47|nr:hypothetical protein [Methylobacterium sp. 092160098-2]MDE4913999.1 hypothetical protein [Methylobacterium sp. 092160098-2]
MTRTSSKEAAAEYFGGMVVSFRSAMGGLGRAALLASALGAAAPVAAPSPAEAAQARGVSRPTPRAWAPGKAHVAEETRFLDEVLHDADAGLAVPQPTQEVEPLAGGVNPIFQQAKSDLLTLARSAEEAGLQPELLIVINAAAEEIAGAMPPGRRDKLAGPLKLSEGEWARTLSQYAPAAGLSRYGSTDASGRFLPAPQYAAALREARFDTAISSALVAARAADDGRRFADMTGRAPRDGEALLAHFLGVEATVKLVRAAAGHSRVSAERLVPEAAKAQPAFFANGLARVTAADVLGVAATIMREGTDVARRSLHRFSADASESMDSHIPAPRFG